MKAKGNMKAKVKRQKAKGGNGRLCSFAFSRFA
jgi:hypothetical protein